MENLENLETIEDRYQKIKKIGEGTYGKVFQAKDLKTDQIVALKKVKNDYEEIGDEGIPSTALREISCLKALDHPNVVKLVDVVYIMKKNKLYLVFEYIDYDLKAYQKKIGKIPEQTVKSYMHQILKGIEHCHSRRIFHRDLKPQNILVNNKGDIKIADFGLGKIFGIPLNTITHEVETLWYRAPEILLGDKLYSLPVDVWSIGCIFAELIIGHPLFHGDSEIDQIFKIFQFFGTPKSSKLEGTYNLKYWSNLFPRFKSQKDEILKPIIETDPQAADLLVKLIDIEPAKRISVSQALKHPYFDNIQSPLNSQIFNF
ncbi:cyclin-dependent kinase-like Serine/Threonine kinase family protein (macronuclear) [Tetrahymena thermophila SB210]|uniref:Cyclin-dependent kinase 2 homolog n=1 Tax=Tetrahymena thermophila (strain SB210) TaxID=312017 RepID=I7MJV4_TETTS|nr:cyclin-dependent kinase-like Serine/Threonine kinase family protein [Tetrahymena thermophila SB210]EAR97232.2 cyclin-dependent kinase-like Serine/Threonine kinase family protein [Tetrahymena thermophila SB210]|eukprot:XP_001017477.2 cyclin-dependent kinase-like Serine/Threonine kinase family protein [Tetrahymena thermophila SB210]